MYLKWINVVVYIGDFLSDRKVLWSLLCRVAIFDRYELIAALLIEQLQFIICIHRSQWFTKIVKKIKLYNSVEMKKVYMLCICEQEPLGFVNWNKDNAKSKKIVYFVVWYSLVLPILHIYFIFAYTIYIDIHIRIYRGRNKEKYFQANCVNLIGKCEWCKRLKGPSFWFTNTLV